MLRRIGRLSTPLFPTKSSMWTSFPHPSSSSSSSCISSVASFSRQYQQPYQNIVINSIFVRSSLFSSHCSHRMYSVVRYNECTSSGLRGNMSVLKRIIMNKHDQQHRTYNPCAKFKNQSPRKATGNKKCRNLKPKKAAVKRFIKTAYGLKHGHAG